VNDQPVALGTAPEARASLDPLLVAIVRALRSIELRLAVESPNSPRPEGHDEALAA